MAQNIYDRPDFFAGYSRLRRSTHGLEGAGEWPAIRALLPDLGGKRIADLGCGFGWFARWARQSGAAHVTGFDVSENMIARARADTNDAGIDYVIADLERLELPADAFDFVYSSLAVHYIEDFGRLMRVVHRALRPVSHFIFSIEHPISMAPGEPGWMTNDRGQKLWPLNRYAVEGPRTTDWLANGVVKHHRTIGTTLNTLIETGFSIRHVQEWAPSAGDLAAHPEWAEELERPMMLIVSALKA